MGFLGGSKMKKDESYHDHIDTINRIHEDFAIHKYDLNKLRKDLINHESESEHEDEFKKELHDDLNEIEHMIGDFIKQTTEIKNAFHQKINEESSSVNNKNKGLRRLIRKRIRNKTQRGGNKKRTIISKKLKLLTNKK